MSAVLRAYGEHFDVDAFLEDCKLPICAVKRRGAPVAPKSQPNGRTHERSGVHVVVSEADFDQFPQQVQESIQFLHEKAEQIRRLITWPGVDGGTIDFGIERRDVVVQCDCLPPELVRLAGELGLGIELSSYPRSNEAESERSDE